MHNPFKRLSTFLGSGASGPGEQPPATDSSNAADPGAGPIEQHALALREVAGDEPGLRAPTRLASRALHAGMRTSTSVAVTPTPVTAVAPMTGAHAQTHGVVLTETERVRLRIMQAQLRLASLMLYEGRIDGMLNLDTVAALRHFQTLKGLRESGQVTAATLRALGVPAD
jgi:hypothetical protein